MEKLHEIKHKLVDSAYEQIMENSENVNTCELGEVIDMIKDIEEAIYYHTVTEAMDDKAIEGKTMVTLTSPHTQVVS